MPCADHTFRSARFADLITTEIVLFTNPLLRKSFHDKLHSFVIKYNADIKVLVAVDCQCLQIIENFSHILDT